MPEFGLTVKPLIERPGNAMASATPGCSSASVDMRRMTASVRSSEAASGSCAKATRYCLSWVGTKPAGTLVKLHAVSPTNPPYTTSAMALLRITPATPSEYFCDAHAKNRLNGRNNQPNTLSIPRESASFFAPCGFSNSADNAGLKVSELKAEMTVEIAIVIANCL